jgi:hypothetical protein
MTSILTPSVSEYRSICTATCQWPCKLFDSTSIGCGIWNIFGTLCTLQSTTLQSCPFGSTISMPVAFNTRETET